MAGVMDYTKLPMHMQGGVQLYIERGIMTGSFLTAVMENKLADAFVYADEINEQCMKIWVEFLWNDAPIQCWGSEEKVAAWKKKGGLLGETSNP